MKPTTLLFFFTWVPSFLIADTFLSLRISDLSFEKENYPPQFIDLSDQGSTYSRSLQSITPTHLPYIRTPKGTHSFLSHRSDSSQNKKRMKYSLQRLIFCFYTQDPEIKGELFLNEKKGGSNLILLPSTSKTSQNYHLNNGRKKRTNPIALPTTSCSRNENLQALPGLGIRQTKPKKDWPRYRAKNQPSLSIKPSARPVSRIKKAWP